jgi:hypothetical protein
MAALVAVLFAVLLAHGARAQPESNTTADARRELRGKGRWHYAKATWYGAPTGAGPLDNGIYICANNAVVLTFLEFLCFGAVGQGNGIYSALCG